VSDFNRQSLAATGLMPAGHLRRIYDAVDVSRAGVNGFGRLAFRRKYSIPPDCPLVVQVSWIRPEKGLPELLEAARLVLAQNPDVHFAFVGEGTWREEYTRRTIEMGLGHRIIWTGLVADPLAEGVYAAADVVCQVSRWQEAFGWTIAEAMACRKPLVATRVGGIPELVKDDESGYLVPNRNPGAIAQSILRLLSDPELRERMGAAGRKAVEGNFNLGTNVAKLLDFYGVDSAAN
jgi:glycosyltransferase involved in cell wall biosynthesis